MAFNITEFNSSISNYGILPQSKFLVYFSTPRVLNGVFSNSGNPLFNMSTSYLMQMRAEQARIPGINIMTTDNNRYGLGVVQRMPFNAQFTDTSITFTADARGQIYKYFYSWFTSIIDFNGSGSSNINGTFFANPQPSYTMGYKDDYVTDIYIMVFDNYGNLAKQITLYNAFPNTMNDINLDWGNDNSVMKITVGLSFKEWSMDVYQNPGINFLGFLQSIPGISTYPFPTNTFYPTSNFSAKNFLVSAAAGAATGALAGAFSSLF